MTKKDYKKIADALRSTYEPGFTDKVIDALSNVLREDNPRFDYDRFRDASVPNIHVLKD